MGDAVPGGFLCGSPSGSQCITSVGVWLPHSATIYGDYDKPGLRLVSLLLARVDRNCLIQGLSFRRERLDLLEGEVPFLLHVDRVERFCHPRHAGLRLFER